MDRYTHTGITVKLLCSAHNWLLKKVSAIKGCPLENSNSFQKMGSAIERCSL